MKRGQRRSGHRKETVTYVENNKMGELQPPHHVDLKRDFIAEYSTAREDRILAPIHRFLISSPLYVRVEAGFRLSPE